MAAETMMAGAEGRFARPYAPSWLDILFNRITELPGPTSLAYAALLVVSIVLSNASPWLSGLRDWGVFDPAQVFWGAATIGLLAATHHLRNVARSAFDTFRPALGASFDDPDRARYELSTMPARLILVVTVFGLALTPVYYAADPVASQIVGISGLGLVLRGITEGFTTIVVLSILVQAVRQMRGVRRLHAIADNVDPFRPAPLHAFSRLTAQTGVVLIVFNVLGLVVNPAVADSASLTLYAPWLIVFVGGAIVIFVVPLLGMRDRLSAIKLRLEAASDGRMQALLGELHDAIDARATDRVDAIDRTIAALRREREIIAKLPTWPWSTTTIRGFGSALLLPIVLFLIQRYLGSALGG
ncbi:MAG: hypothetical protein ABI573_12045 [Chloroflexota bacterium]